MAENLQIKHTKIPFVVKTGNWKLRVLLKIPMSEELEEYSYIEASTQAVEYCFGQIEDDREFDMLYLLDDKGKNFFDKNYHGDICDIPEPRFGIFTAAYIEDDENDDNKWWFFLTSEIFANASQPENFAIAKKFEKRWKKHIMLLKNKQKESNAKVGFKKVKKKKD
jgi:hypothetical protein